MKKNLFKNIFYIFFAFCFLSAGLFSLSLKPNEAAAEDTSEEVITNTDIPSYFDATQYDGDEQNAGSLIDSNVFMYYTNQSLKLSLLTNGSFNAGSFDAYQYVYYPNPDDITKFYYYKINTFGLKINGVDQDINLGNYVIDPHYSFTNKSAVELQSFEMVFSAEDPTADNHVFKITDSSDNVVEGIYTLTLDIALMSCTDGRSDGNEETIIDNVVPPIVYSFYVVDRSHYLINGEAIVDKENFDHSVQTTTSLMYDYYLYSNYSSEETANKIPNFSYDYERYEITINKELSNQTSSQSLLYDKDSHSIVSTGDEIASFVTDETTHTNTVYLYDVGNYAIEYNDILLLDFTTDEHITTFAKHSLEGVSNITKSTMVYMYGYQANYTDMDGTPDANNIRPVEDMKLLNLETDSYEHSADITSGFLNSNASYSQANGNRTFVISNVANYINDNHLVAEKTDQTPIKFTSNATLSNAVNSYIYTTKQLSSNYQETSSKLGTETLYRTRFTGQAEGASGTYIYIIAYTFNNYYASASTLSANTIFYQVFYFEINKDLPSIELKTESGKDIAEFMNESVQVYDTTNDNPYNKDVEIRIYAQDFNGNLLASFGGENGVTYTSLLADENDDFIVLEQSAHYTIRLYFKNQITASNIKFASKTGKFREIYFTIDKQEISNITGTNVSEIINSTNYSVSSQMTNFVTNQNMVVSWDNKASGASTYAYYRYFKINATQYYNTDEVYLSSTIQKMLEASVADSYLPVNYTLDMSTTNSSWNDYKGNAIEAVASGTVSSEYVFSDEGLYIVDVHDAAGNRAFKIFMIDYSAPLFALHDGTRYSLPNSSIYLSENSTLFWAKYKALYIRNFTNIYTGTNNPSTITEDNLTDNFYKDHDGKTSKEIYNTMYYTLQQNGYMRRLVCDVTPPSTDIIPSYTGLYITIPVSDVYYYLTQNNTYEARSGSVTRYRESISADHELTYQVLIRDLSNTMFAPNFSETALVQYTQYYSAYQKLTVSFDSSEFTINYDYTEGGKQNIEKLESNNVVYGTDTEGRSTKTTWLNPIRLEKPFYFVVTPTQTEGGSTIQVESVTVNYYPYEIKPYTYGGITYNYYALSDSYTQTIYSYDTASTEPDSENIRLNYDNITMAGKYEITRVYKTGTGYTYNEKDYYSRTYVLYVDRNDVITNPELINDESGSTHLESTVGGDIFISMYDNSVATNLVVTFPDSANGNATGSSLYNSVQDMTTLPRTILTTNLFPVKVYVPQYKYTINAQMTETTDGYFFEVNNNSAMVHYDETRNNKVIPEYALYAEIYKDGIGAENLIARSANTSNPTIDTVTVNENNFLEFYKTSNNEKLEYLTESGVYYVRVYQAMFESLIGSSLNSNKQNNIFCFEIQSTDPDFTVTTTSGAILNSVEGSRPGDPKETYYTNQSTVTLLWNAGSDYIAEIDQNEITFKVGGRVIHADDDVWIQRPTLSNNTYISQISLSKLGIYSNDSYIDITMQFKNHDARFYNTVTKRIYVDLSTPHQNIDTLVETTLAGNWISALSASSLRSQYTANMEETTRTDITSYNTSNSNSTGNFAYYSYIVDSNYLETLRNTKTYLTYVRAFVDSEGNSTKFNTEYVQETSPADFLPSNFTEVSNARLTLEAGKYYEIVETDMAGNMTIYTVYIASYEPTEDDTNKLITYSNSIGTEKSYTIDDYNAVKSYDGAVHNIYEKSGFVLEKLNYFGDVWAQLKLTTTTTTGSSTTSNLMLTPWDPTHAYAFINGNVQTIEISRLIDGSLNSRYKHTLSFYNRQTGAVDTFYINTRNTDLYATLTDTQSREYIRFSAPSDAAINSSTFASTYLTSLKITAADTELYNATNKLGYASLWTADPDVIILANDTAAGTITFEINPQLGFASNTRIIYEFTNNYGEQYTEIHLYKESIISKEITSEHDLYAFYSTEGTLYYITKDGIQYNYNPNKYTVEVYDYINGTKSDTQTQADVNVVTNSGVSTLTLTSNTVAPYHKTFVLDIKDSSNDSLVKSIYVKLYDQLPEKNLDPTAANVAGQFKLLDASRNNITDRITAKRLPSDEAGYFSEVTLMYALADTFIPIKYSISTDKENWTEVDSGSVFRNEEDSVVTYYLKVWYDETYLANEVGAAKFVFGNVDTENQIYEFNLSSLTSTFWVEKTVDGETTIVKKSGTIFKTASGTQYSNHYIVNLNYSDRNAIQIKTNKEQDIAAKKIAVYDENAQETSRTDLTTASELWKISNDDRTSTNVPAFSTYIIITYIPESNNFVEKFLTYNTNGIVDTSDNLLNKTSKSFVVSQDFTTITKIELLWSKYNGIVQNEVNISLVKDGVEINPTVFAKELDGKQYNYCYLAYSGKYLISLYDNAGNVQKFNYGNPGQSDKFTFIFLKDVPFTVTYTNPENVEETTSLPIKQAIYNGKVSLNIDKASRSDFYAVGGYPTLNITRNGTKLTAEDYETTSTDSKISYSFEETGFYEYYFAATSNLTEAGEIRQEKYQFTIINANEYRYSYIFNQYASYYVEKIEKDGVDITSKLIKTLDVKTITINSKEYLLELPLSYLDEKTGAGTYLITVNSNEKYIKSSTLPTSWTYQVIIQVGSAPISISIAEGKATTNKVDISFNRTNIYQEMGECTVRIISYTTDGKYRGVYYSTKIDATTQDQVTTSIEARTSGSYFVQIVAPSGNLLYSYRVEKQEPMNAASIIIIVAAVVLVIVIGIIVFRLRKKISVK